MTKRIERVNELLKEEVSQLILREIDFGGALVTVIKVDTSPDLRIAKIKISVLPIEKAERALNILEKNIFQLQQMINKKLEMKPVPKICFEIDQVEIKAQRVEKLLQEIKKN